MRRPKGNEPRQFDEKALGLFIKTVREAQGKSLQDVARDAELNRQALYNLERGSNLPSIRTIEAVCQQIGLDPIEAISAGFGSVPGNLAGKRHVLQKELNALSHEDLDLVAGIVKLMRGRPTATTPARRKAGRSSS